VQLGNSAIVSTTAGTYLGINQTGSADFFNFQTSGVSMLQASSTGALTAVGGLTVGSASTAGTLAVNNGAGLSNQTITFQAPPSNKLTVSYNLVLPGNINYVDTGSAWSANMCL